MKRIGIMGGTFDPIHTGHLILGEKAYEQFQLDQVLFMPAGNPPHKRNRAGLASDKQRVDMVRLAIEGNPHFALSLEEMEVDGYSYTYLTLERLKKQNPHSEYYFIIGADSLFQFDTWMKPERISEQAHILAAGRDDKNRKEMEERIKQLSAYYQGNFSYLSTPNVDVSSHMLRDWIKRGESIRYFVPEAVNEYILKNGLYLDSGME